MCKTFFALMLLIIVLSSCTYEKDKTLKAFDIPNVEGAKLKIRQGPISVLEIHDSKSRSRIEFPFEGNVTDNPEVVFSGFEGGPKFGRYIKISYHTCVGDEVLDWGSHVINGDNDSGVLDGVINVYYNCGGAIRIDAGFAPD